MRRMLPVTGLVLFFVLVGMSAAHAIENRISGIQVEEGPNNTVVTIVGSGTPTFTVFKLLDPVRLLVDIAGASMDQLSGTRQVRNGVVHDIETLQFASSGRDIGRVVIGFDKDAPYSVKSNGNSIRIVIDGTDRSLPKLESQKIQDALNRAKHALESEKKLRIKLQKAEEREAKLRIRHTSMETERKGLTADLAAARQQVARLEALDNQQKQGSSLNAEMLKEAAHSAEQKRLAAEKATAVAKAELKALSDQKRYALEEKNAIEIAIELATKRREMLQKILAAEEIRRTDAQRVRVQSDALKKNNHKLELTKSKRAELAAESLHTMENRRGALEEARRRADRLMKKEQQAKKEIAALKSKIQSLSTGDRGSKKRIKLLHIRLSKLERKHIKKLNLLRKSVKTAELKAAQRETEHQNILAQLQNSEARLRRELAVREQSLTLSKRAGDRLQRRLTEREKMVTQLIERDKRRMVAIVAAGKARSARIVAEEKMAQFRLQKKALTLRIEQLSQMNLDLMAQTGKNPSTIKSTLAKSKLEVKRLLTSLKANEGKGVELAEKLIAEKQSLLATRATLAQEQQDLAAVLQQKNLFAAEAEMLQKNNEAERKNLSELKSEILQSNERLTDLKMKGQFQQQLVSQLQDEHERRNLELTRINKEQEAGQLALSKTNQALSKEQIHFKQLFEKRRKEARLLSQITEKRKAESWRVDKLARLWKSESTRLTRLKQERQRQDQKLQALSSKIAHLEELSTSNSDTAALKRMLKSRQDALIGLRAKLTHKDRAGLQNGKLRASLKAALKKAQAEARRSKKGRQQLVRLKKFLASQRRQIRVLQKGDLGKVVATKEAELKILKSAIAKLKRNNRSSIKLSKLKSSKLRAELLTQRKASRTASAQIKRLNQRLAKQQAKVSVSTQQLAQSQKTVNTLKGRLSDLKSELSIAKSGAKLASSDLDKAKRINRSLGRALTNARGRIQSLVGERRMILGKLVKLKRNLRTTNGSRSPVVGGHAKLAQLQKVRNQLAAAMEKERARRKSEQDTAYAQIEILLTQKLRLERNVDSQRNRIAQLLREDKNTGALTELKASLKAKKFQISKLRHELTLAQANKNVAQRLAKALDQAKMAQEEASQAQADVLRLEHALKKAVSAGQNTASLKSELLVAKRSLKNLEKQLTDERLRHAAHDKASKARIAALEKAGKNSTVLAKKVSAKTTSKATARLTNVAFSEQNNASRIVLELDSRAEYDLLEKTDQRMVLLLKKVRIPKFLERRLDTSDFYGPVQMVSTYTDPNSPHSVRVVVDLSKSVRNQVRRTKNSLVWEFQNGKGTHVGTKVVAHSGANSNIHYEPTAVGGQRAKAPPGGLSLPGGGIDFGVLNPFPKRRKTRRYKGRKISLTVKDAPIKEVLTFLARESGVNIIAGGTVSGTITIHLKEVPWDLALDMILKSKGLDYVVQDGVYRVAPVDVIQKEFEREVEKRKKMTELKRLVVRLVTVNYADADNLKGRVKDLLSKKGSVSTDIRTNTLIVKDIEEHVIAAEDLVRRLDTETPQVLIEARIVEASSNFSEEVGIQWGGNYVASPAFGNETGLLFPGIIGVSGAADDANAPTSGLLDNSPNFAVNLPAAVGGGKGGGIGLSLGTLSGSGNISLRLSAAEERGTVKIISSPRIATLDNNEATIQQGISIPISVVSSLGVNTQFFNAQLSLKVKPHVTQDGNVNLDVHITKNEPNFSQTGASGAPTIERKEAKTQLLVRDGDTAVIGGIYTRNSARSFKKVPVLGDIPFLGWLFKSRVESDKRSELLLFITPRIINRAASRVRVD